MRQRGRRLLLLLANLGHCVRLAGGTFRFASYALRKIIDGDWRHVVAWMTMAVSYGRRADAGLYRRWLARQPAADPPDGDVLVVLSTAGMPVDQLDDYLGLVASRRRPWMDLVIVATPDHRVQVESGLRPSQARVVVVEADTGVADALLTGMKDGLDAASRHRYTALMAPGAVPGEMPFSNCGRTLLYGDEDRIDAAGLRSRPFFKPATFSPDLLLHADFLSSCLAMTAELARRLADGRDDRLRDLHSLALLAVESAETVVRVEAFTAHGFLPAPAEGMPAHLPAYVRGRYGEYANVETGAEGWSCRFAPSPPKVSIIIPTRDRIDLLGPCVEGIYATNAGRFEVIVIDNGSLLPETARWLDHAGERWPSFRAIRADEPFNWSRLSNRGMREATGDVFVLLNNDTESLHEGWLDRLADVALRSDVGAVGALLLYPDGKVQHAGVVTGFGGCADHIYIGTDPEADDHLYVPPTLPRNVSAVTGACLAVSRATVDDIGPLDENYRVTGSDVEFCLRALKSGRVNVYFPDVRLIHRESQSRRRSDPAGDVERLRELVAQGPVDPYFNPKLSMISLYPSYPL